MNDWIYGISIVRFVNHLTTGGPKVEENPALVDRLVFPITYRVSTILLVVQDFATSTVRRAEASYRDRW